MCGYCGFTGSMDTNEKSVVLKNMMDTIIHRGPESDGVFMDDHIAMGFRRLGIIDLEEGNQPIYSKDGTLVMMFNGEIYNYKELKEELIALGHEFSTQSDSEVALHLYMEYGVRMPEFMRGMFSIVIYNRVNHSVFALRDFFGIKPLNYCITDKGMLFGSEIKSFMPHPWFSKELNEEALESYLTFQYSVLDETFFKGVYRLLPGHYMIYKDGKVEQTRYFYPEFKRVEKTLNQTVSDIDAVVQDSIKYHKVSDVEVGSFLSSGVDSSYVAACFKGTKTFTVGFDYENYNEIDYAKSLSEKVGVENISKLISKEEYWNILPKIQYFMDEPLADPSAVALYFVSELASKYVKVALSGEGADEFFGGYNIYREPLDLKIITDLPMPIRRFLGKIASLLPFSVKGKNFFIRAGKTVEERFIGNANMFSKKEREDLLKNPKGTNPPHELTKRHYDKVRDYDDITKMQYLDIHMWMPGDILLKADRMSMAHALEVRVPYLDKEVFKLASSIQTDYRINRTATKYAFRLAAKEHLPEECARKKKLGFPVPIRIWLKEDEYFNKVLSEFESEHAAKYFKTDRLKTLLIDHKIGKRDNSRKIWTVYMFLVWYRQYFL